MYACKVVVYEYEKKGFAKWVLVWCPRICAQSPIVWIMQKAQGSVSRPVVILSQLFIKWLLPTCPLVPHHPDIPFECRFAWCASISGLLKYEIAALWNSLCIKHFLEWNAWKCKKAPISDIPRLASPSQNGCEPSSIGIDNHNIKGKNFTFFSAIHKNGKVCIWHVLADTLISQASKMWQ